MKKNILKRFFLIFCLAASVFGFTGLVQAAGLYDSGQKGADYLDIIGEHGFEREAAGEPGTSFAEIILIVINAVLSFLGIIFLILIIYGGYTWMFAGGNEATVDKAKKIILNSTIGVAVVLASAAIAQFVIKTLAEEGIDATTWNDPESTVMDIIVRVVNAALSFLGVFLIGFIIYGGYMWMFSGGNQERVDKARKILINSVIGAVIVLMAFAISQFVFKSLGVA